MDLYSILSFEVFLVLPFLCYFLFFKKNGGRSLYSGRDIFYPIKFYLAKKVVTAAQEKWKRDRKNLIEKDIEPEVNFSDQECKCFQSFSGCDQKGNSLMLRFTLRPSQTAEVILVLRLSNGIIYTFPGSEKIHIKRTKDFKWKLNGLIIENLEPYRRLRIVYNGLLQNISSKNYGKIEHVQFNFIFNCCSPPKFYPEDCDTSLLTETLATRPWKDASWKDFLSDDPNGYEQFGTLLGTIRGDALSEETELNLTACRSKYEGPDEDLFLDREIKIFVAEVNGVLINMTLRLFEEQQSQLCYGYICHKNNITEPITAQDIRIQSLMRNKSLPELFIARVNTQTDEYTCVFNVNKSSTAHHQSGAGFELFNTYAECDVNVSHGRALLEFYYHQENNVLKDVQLTPILTEKKVDTLPKEYVVPIRSEEAKILDITGGKGNSLALLSSLNSEEFTVPDGFIITVNAFRQQLAENKFLQEAVRNIDDAFCGRVVAKPEEVCAVAVEMFANQPVDNEVAKGIIRELEKHSSVGSGDLDSWAVRSSAIGEDSEELSAAGQNETVLGCRTEKDILEAVSKCWASLFTFQSVQYRWQHGAPIKAVMAVVVQKMVPSEAAGVLFTWHPTSSNPSQMVITSNFGLGESVVSGKSDPDTFVLNRSHDGKVCLVDQTIGAKDKVISLTKNGVEEITLSNDQGSCETVNGKNSAERWSLTKQQVLQLGRIGVLLEEVFGGPRDIEWAFYKDHLYLLQSRPITTLNNWTDFELTHELNSTVITENSLFTMANCGEVFPTAISALGRTTILCYLDNGIQRYIDNQVNLHFIRTVSTFQHRVMIDCILALYMNERKPEIQMATRVLDLAIFGHPVINEKINQIVRNRLGPMPRFRPMKETIRRWNDSRKVKEAAAKAVTLAKSLDFGIKDDDDLKTIYNKIIDMEDRVIHVIYYHGYLTSSSVFWQMVCMMVLVGNEKELNTEQYADFANILSSCEDVESAEVPLYLEKIARIIKDEGNVEEFCTIEPESGISWLQKKCPEAHKVFQDFLQKHGHRCLGEFELMEETWGMNPSKLIPILQANAEHTKEITKQHKTINEVIDDLETPLNFVTRSILKYALSNLRVAVGTREQSKSATILAVNKCRLAFRKLATAMVRMGLLPSENLIFHLTKYELGELIKRRDPLLITKAMRRQKMYPKWNNLRFPELSYGLPQPENEFHAPIELRAGSKCSGTPVCTGSIQARACVINHLDEIGTLEKGDILITYCTDIGWSPYFPMLSGVVTELGGLVSHGAVVAREYGLPCIVGVKNATKLFKTGDIVYLSGKTGELGKV